jgi:hypothetical protein
MNFGLARTAQMAAWQNYAHPNARRVGTASTNASVTYTSNGAVTSTGQFKYGTASEFANAFTDDIETTGGSPTFMDYGTGEFTIEFWIYIPTVGSGHSNSCDLLSNNTSGGFGIRLAQSFNTNGLNSGAQYINIFARAQADLDYWTLPSTWPAGQWNFVVLQRKGTDMSCWVNGSVITRSGSGGGTRNFASGTSIRIGTADSNNGIGPAYIDEVCFSNTYRYTNISADTPVPTAPFTVDTYTTQLLHMDGTNGGTSFTNATS